jgi:hypothetical protein
MLFRSDTRRIRIVRYLNLKGKKTLLGQFGPLEEVITVLPNVGSYLPIDDAYHPTRPGST